VKGLLKQSSRVLRQPHGTSGGGKGCPGDLHPSGVAAGAQLSGARPL